MSKKEEIIQNYMTSLGLSRQDAEQLYKDDFGGGVNEEQDKLDKAASAVKVAPAEKTKVSRKPRTVKVSPEKKAVFDCILTNLTRIVDPVEVSAENIKIITENKYISVKVGEKIIKINIVEERPPK